MTLIMLARVGRSMLSQLSAEEFGRTVAGVQAGEARVQLRRSNHIRHRSDQPAIKSSPAGFLGRGKRADEPRTRVRGGNFGTVTGAGCAGAALATKHVVENIGRIRLFCRTRPPGNTLASRAPSLWQHP
jgi:hypothetical protein